MSNSIAICSIRFVDKKFENLKHRLPITDWVFRSMPSLFTPCTSGKIHVRVYAVTGELQIRLHSLPLEHYVTRNVIGCFRRPHTWAHARWNLWSRKSTFTLGYETRTGKERVRRTGDSTGSVGEFARELTTSLKYFWRKSDEMSKEGIEMIKVIFSVIFEAT